jgi:RNA polymerase sigma-70 factor, ECF subfamily
VRVAPGIGALVGRAVALAQAGDPVTGLEALGDIPADRVTAYQPYWAARGHLFHLAGLNHEARQAWERAMGLTDDPSLSRYLSERIAAGA